MIFHTSASIISRLLLKNGMEIRRLFSSRLLSNLCVQQGRFSVHLPTAHHLRFQSSFYFNLNVRQYSSKSASDDDNEPKSSTSRSALGRKRMTRARLAGNEEGSMFAVEVPDYLPIVPVLAVRKNPVFPRFVKIVEVSDPDLRELIIRKIHLKQPYIGIFLRKDDRDMSEVIMNQDDVYNVGTFCFIHEIEELPGDVMRMVIGSVRRIKYSGTVEDGVLDHPETSSDSSPDSNESKEAPTSIGKNLLWNISNLESDEFEMSDEIKALSAEVIHCAREIMSHNAMYRDLFSVSAIRSETFADDPARLADLGAVLSTAASSAELQEVMNELDVKKRLHLSLGLLKKEVELINLQQKISQEVEARVKSQNRRHMLLEQLKIIKQELGMEKDDRWAIDLGSHSISFTLIIPNAKVPNKTMVSDKFKQRLQEAKLPEHIKQAIEEEISRLEQLDVQSAEFNVTRTYLDWLTCLPWGKSSAEEYDLKRAQEILDEDHYGMIDVKKRILEFIAVSKLRNTSQGKIMCFAGPPGVGKTSIARSIARALNREYYRFSVGGLVDVAEIKGHRRTYVGAMPGKMVQCLKKVQTENPLVLIDEIDKIGRAGHAMGDPSSALLEMLDPEQNANFLDHYLDLNIDLSKVLFVCTANVLDTIPEPLKDRMEIIRTASTAEEKLAIAKQYLIPKAIAHSGVGMNAVAFDDSTINTINRQYCRESGVRGLEKQIEKIFRKVALEIVKTGKEEKFHVTPDELSHYLGKPVFTHDRMYDTTPIGVVAGLAWTSLGGCILYAEASSVPGGQASATPIITGHMGEVMKESVQIALTYAKNYLQQSGAKNENSVLKSGQIHIHVPEGASPKDGPSAGCTLVTAMLSLSLGIPVKANIAMTGEISLKGNILPVGGIKEKVIAAKRGGITEIILPIDNRKDFEELPDFIKNDVSIHYVRTYFDIFRLVF
ncbi:hypothetical protein ACOME3_009829 [Neoechinorhynchus agilis]